MMSDTPAESSKSPEAPHRVLGGAGSLCMVAGSMLGIGIFLAPPMVARYVESPALFLAVWIFGGLVALAGAAASSELATMFPQSGGDYVFQREAFGPSVAFAGGWVLWAAIFGGSIAAVASGLSSYQIPAIAGVDLSRPAIHLPFGSALSWSQLLAVGFVALLTGVNHLSARLTNRVQVVTTLLAVGIAATGAIYAIAHAPATPAPLPASRPPVTAAALIAAYLPVYFTYSGWNSVTYVSGEVHNPSRNLPRSLIGGTAIITIVYVVFCLGLLKVLGVGGLQAASEASSAGARLLSGPTGELMMTLAVTAALLASLNASILGSSRVAYAMAKGGALVATAGHLHPKRGVPTRALWLQAAWAALLILTESFEQILSMVSVAMVLLGSITVAALFVLRWRRPELVRPHRVFGYPVVPAFYLLSNLVVIGVMLPRAISPERGGLYPLLGLAILLGAYISHRVARAARAT
jgi:basic amino acid/polyamine antiporter, APA family